MNFIGHAFKWRQLIQIAHFNQNFAWFLHDFETCACERYGYFRVRSKYMLEFDLVYVSIKMGFNYRIAILEKIDKKMMKMQKAVTKAEKILSSHIKSSINCCTQGPIAMIRNVVVDDCVFFYIRLCQCNTFRGGCWVFRMINLKFGVTPNRKIQAIDEKYPINSKFVHFFRIQRWRFPIEIVAILIVQSCMDLYWRNIQKVQKISNWKLFRRLIKWRELRWVTFLAKAWRFESDILTFLAFCMMNSADSSGMTRSSLLISRLASESL